MQFKGTMNRPLLEGAVRDETRAMSLDALNDALTPVLAVLAKQALDDPDAAQKLARALPLDGPELTRLRQLVRAGVSEGWLADRENDGIRYSRVKKTKHESELGIECVNMKKPGPGHLHPLGEIDLCFAVEGDPRFDGQPEGWTVYPPASWHVPTVSGGEMDILYFLPGGQIQFGPKPSG
jgi:Domain of unknown function (DUF4863)